MHTGHYLLIRHKLKDALVDGESHGRCPGKGADEAKAAIDLEGEMRRGTEKGRCDEVLSIPTPRTGPPKKTKFRQRAFT